MTISISRRTWSVADAELSAQSGGVAPVAVGSGPLVWFGVVVDARAGFR